MLLLIPSDSESIQERKIALVIGNGAYESSPLVNPVNDANDMTAVLKKLGFSVRLKINANQKSMENSIRAFGKKLRSGGVGLFYFAGHGLQVHGRNYLVPIGADIESEADVKYESVDAERILSQMYEAQNGLNIIILDACRDNPYARSFRTSERGLAKMDAPTGSILAYSTAPGSVAADGAGRNGLYTSMLLKHMMTADVKIEDVFKKVRNDVIEASSDKQVPWESSSLRGDFYFNSKRGVAVNPEVPLKGRLSVDTYPKNARIIVSNIALKFYQGIELDAGSYHVEVSADGYKSQKIWITLDSGQDKSIYVRLNKHAVDQPPSQGPREIKRDGRFIAYDNGIVKDTRTRMEWLAGPDKPTNWYDAKGWIASIGVAGGGWRMPTRNELKMLYQEGVGTRNMTPLLKTTGWWVWSGESKADEPQMVWYFYFYTGIENWSLRAAPIDYSRGFAVRFGK